jgi:hypothetical protein
MRRAPACPSRPRRQAAGRLERADGRRPRRGRRGPRARGLPRRGAPLRRLPAGAHARSGGQAAAHLQGRRRAHQRLPRGPCLPPRGAPRPLPGDLRAALVRQAPPPPRR